VETHDAMMAELPPLPIASFRPAEALFNLIILTDLSQGNSQQEPWQMRMS